MQSLTGRLFAAFVVMSSAFMAGCAAPAITMPKLVPGTVTEAAQLKKIAVLPFEGRYGAQFAAELESSLAGIRINDAPFYQVVTQTARDRILDEQKWSTALVNPKSAVKLGNMLGAQGLYVGQVTTAEYNNTQYVEDRQVCVVADQKGKCKSWRNYTVPCLKRTAQLTVVPQLIDVETGRICYSETFEVTDVSAGCKDTSAPTDGEQMLNQLRAGIIQRLRLQVAPHTENVQVKLLVNDDDIKADTAKQKLKSGMAFATSGRMARACEIWEEGKEDSGASISYLHNLAVCNEMVGRLDRAREMLVEADRKLQKPDPIISASLSRVEVEIARQKKLREQLAGSRKKSIELAENAIEPVLEPEAEPSEAPKKKVQKLAAKRNFKPARKR